MEENITLLVQILKEFDCEKKDIRTYSPLTLAYIGDAIYDLIIRTIIVERANRDNNDLHKIATKYVKAKTQALLIDALLEQLSEEENGVYKRGRNAKITTSAKNASMQEYRKATGFEALIGYLYLEDNMNRILELIKVGIYKINMTI